MQTALHDRLPFTEVQVYTGEPIGEGDDVVEFKLLYSGQLLGAKKNNPRVAQKHAIRKEFHPQLQRLWATHHNLMELAMMAGQQEWRGENPHLAPKNEVIACGLNYFAQWERSGYKFLPLVTDKLCLRCSLDILFLRPEEPRCHRQRRRFGCEVENYFRRIEGSQ